MRSTLQLMVIAARFWPLVAIGTAFTSPAQNSAPSNFAVCMKSKQVFRELVDRVRPLAFK
ncbi:MAG TPA: hypothetical protein VJ721_05815 [Chthoniobacterales bacterium]|nr:hypothetical protein [Chthoniobacterales bacterium]